MGKNKKNIAKHNWLADWQLYLHEVLATIINQ